jgi:mono/diheme cytochrome c family protein
MASPLLHALLAAAVPLSAPTVDFTRDIAPVLAARCFQCHGPDASSRKAGLRLDKRDGALKGGKSGIAAIVPGKPEESELLARVMSTDADERMPPAEGHVALTAAEVDAMRAWIADGAPYAKHWSWEALPDGEARTDLLHASSTARTGASGVTGGDASIDHGSWLRRVHFDIVGLPPSPDAVRAFDADHSPAARLCSPPAPLPDPLLPSGHRTRGRPRIPRPPGRRPPGAVLLSAERHAAVERPLAGAALQLLHLAGH